MKILVLSLLRLGDTLLLMPALADLRRRFPQARIDLVMNKQFVNVSRPLLKMVDYIFEFDRDELQRRLGDAESNIFSAYDTLDRLVMNLNSTNYDQIYNLTQTELSGHFLSVLSGKEKFGMQVNGDGRAQFHSPWLRYLNEVVEGGAKNIFHFCDIFQAATGASQEIPFELKETPAGRNEVDQLFKKIGYSSDPKVILQTSTSDKKKDWPIQFWLDAVRIFRISSPRAKVFLLGAPHEEKAILNLENQFHEQGVTCNSALLSLEGAVSLLTMSDLLVTGDTSIKHLAAFTSISILELALGSSDQRKTGVYRNNGLVISSRENCAPCGHSKDCNRDKYYCHESVGPQLVGMAMGRLLCNDWMALKTLAEEYKDEVKIERVRLPKNGFMVLEDLSENNTVPTLHQIIDKWAWKFYLQKEHAKRLANYGSISLQLKQIMEEVWGDDKRPLLRMALDQLEREFLSRDNKVGEVLSRLSFQMKEHGLSVEIDTLPEEMHSEMKNLEKQLEWGRIFSEKLDIAVSSGIYRQRQLQSALNEAHQQNQIKLKFVRSLKNIMVESQ